MAKFLDVTGVKKLWEKAKAKFASKIEVDNKFGNLNNNYSSLEYSLITNSNEIDLIDTRLDVLYEIIDDLKTQVDNIASVDDVNTQITQLVPFTLRFRGSIPANRDLNQFDKGASIYNLDSTYNNSPLDGMTIYGNMINLVRYEHNVYDDKTATFIYQFILLSSGRIFNRTKWGDRWNEWKEIERVNP